MFRGIQSYYKKQFEEAFGISVPKKSEYIEDMELLLRLLPLVEFPSDVLVIVTGLNHYLGTEPFKEGGRVYFVKEPGNRYDPHAIMAICDGVGKCGYVANSEQTVKQGTLSADLLHGGISDMCKAEVMWVDKDFVICKLEDISYFDLLFNYGKNFCKKGKYELALRLFRTIEEQQESLELFQRMCACYIKLSNKLLAVDYLEKALLIDGENTRTLCLKKIIEEEFEC